MKTRWTGMALRASTWFDVAVLTGVCLTWTSAAAQAPAPPGQTPPARRQAAARPRYTPPKLPFGQPDLQGVWKAWNTAAYDIEDTQPASASPPGGA